MGGAGWVVSGPLRTNTSVKKLNLGDNELGKAGATQLAGAAALQEPKECSVLAYELQQWYRMITGQASIGMITFTRILELLYFLVQL